jgi:CubicO group peptidase (beta-lactamase class C family)
MNNKEWVYPFEEYVHRVVEESQVPGVAVGISKNGEIVYGKGFGYRDVDKQAEVTVDTVFGIGSITKSFTAVAIMQLQEAGQLSVNDPVIKYLPEFRLKNIDNMDKITIHHFLTHTSGLPPLPYLITSMVRSMTEGYEGEHPIFKVPIDLREPETFEEYMELISELDIQLLGEPGTQFSYSNDCFSLLGAIIERVSGKSYETYIEEHILRPAGMEHSGFHPEQFLGYENVSNSYVLQNKQGVNEVISSPKWWDPPAMRACGLLKSTIRDMLKYTEIFCTGGYVGTERILTSNSVKLMMTSYIECDLLLGENYGYGLSILPNYHGNKVVEHSGGGKGVTAQMLIIPEKGLSGIVLTNLDSVPATALAFAAINCMENRSPETSHRGHVNHSMSADRLKEYVGSYQSGEINLLTVTLEGMQLALSYNAETSLLKAIDEDVFLTNMLGLDMIIRFFRDEMNVVYRMGFGGRQLSRVAGVDQL